MHVPVVVVTVMNVPVAVVTVMNVPVVVVTVMNVPVAVVSVMNVPVAVVTVMTVPVAVVTADPVEGNEHGAAAEDSEIQQVGVVLPGNPADRNGHLGTCSLYTLQPYTS